MDTPERSQAMLAEVTCSWGEGQQANAYVVHVARGMLVLEASDTFGELPPLGTEMRVVGENDALTGRLAEQGRAGRFLVSIGPRPVRRAHRLKVCLPGTLRGERLAAARQVEIVDLTTGGCRVRGLELPVGARVMLEFTPLWRKEPVTVSATVAHGTHHATRPWVGLNFQLVALRGGRS